jgi:plasmid stability protein
MAQLLVRNLADDVKAKLQEQAQRHGRSTEEEVREILRAAVLVGRYPRPPLGSGLAKQFEGIGLDKPIEELRGHTALPAELG